MAERFSSVRDSMVCAMARRFSEAATSRLRRAQADVGGDKGGSPESPSDETPGLTGRRHLPYTNSISTTAALLEALTSCQMGSRVS